MFHLHYVFQEEWGPWLLVIDNADNTDLVLGENGPVDYLPFSRRGSILFTSRNYDIATGLDTPNLLPRQMKYATSVQELLVLLANLPLAIKQTSSYIATTGITTTKYLAHCRSSPHSLVKLTTRNPIATTWLMSFNLLIKEKPLATKYLRFMCLMSEREIPMYLLPIEEDGMGHAFIHERMDSALFSMHHLVRLATQNWIRTEGGWDACVDEVIQRLSETCPSSQHKSSAIWTECLLHAHAVLELRGCTRNEIIGKYTMAEQMYRNALKMRLETFGEAHQDTLTNFYYLARTLRRSGKLKDASQLYRKVLTLAKRLLSLTYFVMLCILNDFAILLLRQGQYKEAEHLHRDTFSLLSTTLSANHPSTLDWKYSQAEAMEREALEAMTLVLGKQHQDTLQSMSKLGVSLWHQEKYTEAELLHREAPETYNSMLGPGHPILLRV
ncbi:TPR-like protein [Xylaria venustula]|nr:TPR-like protein [Xylaria venustula]